MLVGAVRYEASRGSSSKQQSEESNVSSRSYFKLFTKKAIIKEHRRYKKKYSISLDFITETALWQLNCRQVNLSFNGSAHKMRGRTQSITAEMCESYRNTGDTSRRRKFFASFKPNQKCCFYCFTIFFNPLKRDKQ